MKNRCWILSVLLATASVDASAQVLLNTPTVPGNSYGITSPVGSILNNATRQQSLATPQTNTPQTNATIPDQKSTSSTDKTQTPQTSAANEKSAAPSILLGDKFSGKPKAINGSTLSFDGQALMLRGIEAPSVTSVCKSGATSWKCGEEARNQLAELVSGGTISCIVTDTSGTVPAASCMRGRDDVSSLVVESGFALADEQALVGKMLDARSDKRGIWAWATASSDFKTLFQDRILQDAQRSR